MYIFQLVSLWQIITQLFKEKNQKFYILTTSFLSKRPLKFQAVFQRRKENGNDLVWEKTEPTNT